MINETKLRYLIKVFECKNISRAAEELFLSRQALSKVIASCEEELGVRLFLRTKSGLQPTQEMLDLLPHFYSILEEYEFFRTRKQAQDAEVSLAVMDCVGDYLSQEFLPQFCRKHPDMVLNIEELSDLACKSLLELHECDFAIVTDAMDFGDFRADHLFFARFCAVVPRDHPLAERDVLSFEDLADQPLIGYSRKNQFYKAASHVIAERGYPFHYRAKTSTLTSALRLVQEGIGAALLWDRDFLRRIIGEDLTVIPIGDGKWGCDFYLLSDPELSPGKKQLRDALLEWHSF